MKDREGDTDMSTQSNSGISRRTFLKAAGGVTLASTVGLPKPTRAQETGRLATLIDLSLCDGCPERDTPACIVACRAKNIETVPEPVDPIPKLLPRGKIEDWSKKKDVTDRLTPYTYLYIQKADVEYNGKQKTLHIPRRCMHCDNPACATICPFTANHKDTTGAVVINKNLCFGGAKCRTVCPWDIPQRQSGIGIYLHILPTLAGNGVMFKCDLCLDLIVEGRNPVCVDACPRQALLIGPREDIYAEARRRTESMNGFIYGDTENGGTSTLYVSPVPFDLINAAIDTGPGKPHFNPVVRSMAKTDAMGTAVLLAPIAGLVAGVAAAAGSLKKSSKEEGPHE